MQFINIAMLFGLLAAAIPIVIQIITRKSARRIPWGAWQFLDLTMRRRKRKVLLEDILLLACRCLALGLLALAFARPFVRPDSPVPWAVTMPMLLLAITATGISFALWRYPKHRLWMMAGGIALFVLSVATVVFERRLNLKRFGLGATKDVVLIIDGSASMSIVTEGKSNFERAVEEAKRYVELAPRNTSFSVIVGGPVPQVMNPVPIADKRVIANTLERIYPANGTMQVAGNLTAAAVTLAAGHNAVKQIVIVGDGQVVGWQLEDKDRWKNLRRVFASLKTQPIITWRTLPLPTSVRNLAIAGIRPSRDIVGSDREVGLDVTLVNAGTEAVTPKGLSLRAEGELLQARGLHQLEPGESQTVTFSHRFTKPGGTLVTAKVESGDDLPNDDTYRYAMPVVGSIKVLLVDGDAGAPPLRRASTYVSLALRPELAKAVGAPGQVDDGKFLVETKTEDVSTAGLRRDFSGFSAVVLAGVRKLSDATRDALADFVALGGGLFVMPGPGADPAFFNGWTRDGVPILPAPLGKWRANKSELDPGAMREMLAKFRTGGDLGTATPERVMDFGEGWTSNAVVLAKLGDGSPFLLTQNVGRGTVIASAAPFDPQSGLVSKRSFVPMVHELVYALARPSAVSLDVRPAEGLSLLLASGTVGGAAASGEGLVGYYYPQPNFGGRPKVRQDRRIDFDWGAGSPFEGSDFPADNFSVRWRGALVPEKTAVCKFYWHADDRFSLRIGGRDVRQWREVRLEAGKPYPIEAKYEEDAGLAKVHLRWQGEGIQNGPVPSSVLRTHAPGVAAAGEVVSVEDPHGETFYAEIAAADAGLVLNVSRSVIPGVYTVSGVPENFHETLRGALTEDGKIRFSVSSGVEESTLAAITQKELSELCRYVQVSQAIKDEDVVKAIGGQSFGKEVWRVLAFAAFLLLVAEPAIARWIAISRRTGDVIDTEGSWIRT